VYGELLFSYSQQNFLYNSYKVTPLHEAIISDISSELEYDRGKKLKKENMPKHFVVGLSLRTLVGSFGAKAAAKSDDATPMTKVRGACAQHPTLAYDSM
jgi:hypothetical protein